jgi:nucleotide-binding universal stress UspA family protein
MVGAADLSGSVRAIVWIAQDSWEATVAAAARWLPPDVEVTLLHVAEEEGEEVVRAAQRGLLGRPHPHAAEERGSVRALSDQAASELLAAAGAALGRPAALQRRRGRLEREVVAACAGMDLLVLARDGERSHLGPRSLGHAARFVVDHAPCAVLLVWSDEAPALERGPRRRGG